MLGRGWSFLLLCLPVLTLLKALTDAVLLRVVPRRRVFRLALEEGLPRTARTLLVKTLVLTGEDSLEQVRQLEQIYLANRDCGVELLLGLLADLPERSTPASRADRGLVRRLESAVQELNRRYEGRFFLFYRNPVYQSCQGTFAGWERKRGALLELARLLRGRRSGLTVCAGDPVRLQGVSYLVTLDGDTDPGVGGRCV